MSQAVPLGSLGNLIQGFSYTRHLDSAGPAFKILQVTNLSGRTVELQGDEREERLDAQRAEAFLARPGQVLLALRATGFRAALVPESFPPAVVGNNLAVMTPDERVHPAFLALVLNSDPMRQQISSLGAGGALLNIPLSKFRELRLRVPSLEQQHALVQAEDALAQHRDAFEAVMRLRRLDLDRHLGPLVNG